MTAQTPKSESKGGFDMFHGGVYSLDMNTEERQDSWTPPPTPRFTLKEFGGLVVGSVILSILLSFCSSE